MSNCQSLKRRGGGSTGPACWDTCDLIQVVPQGTPSDEYGLRGAYVSLGGVLLSICGLFTLPGRHPAHAEVDHPSTRAYEQSSSAL